MQGRVSRRERRQQIQQLLRVRDLAALRALARERVTVAGSLVGLLSEREDLLRWRAIEALGHLARDQAEGDLEGVRDLVRRQLWAMNDESGNVAWHAAEAVGEILCQVPQLAPEYLSILVAQREMPLFRVGVSWAMGRLAGAHPDLVRPHVEALVALSRDDVPAARGYAALALGLLGATEAAASVHALVGDAATLSRYDFERGELVEVSVGELARRAIERLT